VYSFAAPLLVLPFSNSILYIIFILIAGKFFGCIVQFYLCFKVVDSLTDKISISRSSFSKLMRLGSWMAVSNIIAPLLFYSERFFITGIISLTAVTYYATPNEMVTKLLLISGALLGVLFPALSTSFYADPNRTRMLFNQGIKLIFIILFPMTLAIVTFSEEGLRLWLGDTFARESTIVMQWMAVGVLIQGLGHISFATIQGAGRPDMTAKLHFVELIIYIPLIILFAQRYGITGVAWIWVTRIGIDALILTYFSRRLLKLKHRGLMTVSAVGLSSGVVFLTAAHLNGFPIKISFYILFLAIFLVCAWKFLLLQEEKALVLQTVSSLQNT
jgi:O-antigen/teichoic acid export membrane protein